MQLETSIQQRFRESEEISREIQQQQEVSNQEEQLTQQNYYQLLSKKMEKSKLIYQTTSLQTQAQLMNEISTNRFRPQFQSAEEAKQLYDETRSKNLMIEEVLDKIRNENPDLDVILNQCIGW